MNFVNFLNVFGIDVRQLPCIVGSGAPTTATEGAVGEFYMDSDTGDVYKCTAVAKGEYTWEDLSSGSKPDEQIAMLAETDMLPAVHDADGKILTDENGNVILRY